MRYALVLCLPVIALVAGCGHEVSVTPAASASSAPVATAVLADATVEFVVPDMECEGCAGVCQNILAGQPGVASADVDLATKVATVKVDSSKFDQQAALADLQKDFAGAKAAE